MPLMASGQETERVYSYNPGARTGLWSVKKVGVGVLVVMIWLDVYTSYSTSVTTTFVILSSDKASSLGLIWKNGR